MNNTFKYPYVLIDEEFNVLEIFGDVSLYLSLKPGRISMNIVKLINKDLLSELEQTISKCSKLNTSVSSGNVTLELGGQKVQTKIVVTPVFELNKNLFSVSFQTNQNTENGNPFKNNNQKSSLTFILEGNKMGTWDWHLESDEIFFNEEWYAFLGINDTSSKFSISDWEMLIHPDDREKVSKAQKDIIERKLTFYEVEYRKKNKRGEWFYLLAYGKAVEDDISGKISRLTGIHLDITDKKIEEAKLNLQKIRNNDIIELMNEGVIIFDMNKSVIFCNKSAESILGFNAKQIVGSTIYDSIWNVIDEEGKFVPIDFRPVSQTLESETKQKDVIFGVYKGDKKLVWISLNTYLLYNEGSKVPYGVFVVFYDVTESRNNTYKLLDEKKRLDYIVEASNLGTWELDINKDEIIVNDRLANIIGYSLTELQPLSSSNFRKTFKSEDLRLSFSILKSHFKKELDYYEIEVQIKHKNGNWVWIYNKGKVLEWSEKGKPLKMFGTIEDISERKKTEETLYQLALVAKNTSNLVIITDEDRKITWVNEGFTRVSGYSYEEALGQSPGALLQNKKTSEETILKVRSNLDARKPARFEIYNVGKHGKGYWLDVEIQPLTSMAGKFIGFMAIETDITERKKQENERSKMLQELVRNNIELLQFSYIVSHNLRGPVASILGLINLLNFIDKSEIELVNTMLLKSALSLNTVIKDLNEILDLRKPSESRKFVYFKDTLKNALQLLENSLGEKDPEIITDFSELEGLNSISGHLQSIFYNIISNSLKYSKPNEKPIIKISTFKEGKWVYIKFEDNGIGLDIERYKGKIFGLYQRFNIQAEGKGLGLYLVKNNAIALGGDVLINSQLDVGLEITIKLPSK